MQYREETESHLASAAQDKAEHQLGTLKGWDIAVSGATLFDLNVPEMESW
jgi:hypothetical protein